MLEKPKIKFCPNCKGKLTENRRTAQGVKECLSCGTRWWILMTSADMFINKKK